MQYFGGKHRISRDLALFIQYFVTDYYVEPFCGACHVGLKIEAPNKIFADVNEDLILMYNSLLDGWIPPLSVSKEEYDALRKTAPGLTPLRAFAGFGCSFAGKFFGGYARCSRGDDYAGNARNSLLRDYAGNARNSLYLCSDYRSVPYPEGSLVYCDPPYAGTTKYYGTPPFSHDYFWQFCRELSATCTVLVSEYSAPDDFTCIWEKATRTEIRTGRGEREPRVEKLFAYV